MQYLKIKKSQIISSLLLSISCGISCSSLAMPESALSGKELLIAVVSKGYPEGNGGRSCGDFIPEFAELKIECQAVRNAAPQIAFIGDSHTNHYRNSVLSAFESLNPIVVYQIGCFPFAAGTWIEQMQRDANCADKQKKLLDYLGNAGSIETVVLSSRWSLLMTGSDYRGPGDPRAVGDEPLTMALMTDEDKKTFITNGQHFISALLKKGKRIVLMRDTPDLDFAPASCYNIRPVRLGKTEIRKDCSMAQAPFEQRRQLQNAVLSEVLKPFPAVKVYDPVPLFCQNGRCKASDGTAPYYLDMDHVNNYGAQFILKDFMRKFFPELNPVTKVK